MGLEATLQASQHIRMLDHVRIARPGIADDLPAGMQVGPGQEPHERAILSRHQRILHHRRRRGDGVGAQ